VVRPRRDGGPVTPLTMWWAAGETSGSGNSLDISQLLQVGQYGLLAVFVILLLSRKYIVPTYTVSDLKESHERELTAKDETISGLRTDVSELKTTVAALQALTSEKMIPALVQSNTLSAAYVAEIQKRGTNAL
jgi:hypothetical protein